MQQLNNRSGKLTALLRNGGLFLFSASAEAYNVRIGGGDRDFHRNRGDYRERGEFRGARAVFREHGDRGWHRDRSDRVAIIKKQRHRDWN
jgi:hypothetical protein